nr:MAG TPA: hypothetical protein [Caudoviricetes sp.]
MFGFRVISTRGIPYYSGKYSGFSVVNKICMCF